MSINNLREEAASFTMSNMKTNNQGGYISGTLVSLIVSIVVLIGAIGFGAWAFTSRQDYKTNSDKKAVQAADQRQKETEEADAVKYAEAAKSPLDTHKGPDQYGGVTVSYPKTWSAYVIEDGKSAFAVDDYFHPAAVPNVSNKDNAYALRVEVVQQSYSKVLAEYDNDVSSGKMTAAPYSLPKVSTVIGTRFDGQLDKNKNGSLVVLPIRNMTLKIWTEAPSYLADFNTYILPNLSFAP